jgi:hypothetical protein
LQRIVENDASTGETDGLTDEGSDPASD